jgi:predicted DNA binding CopG/RHH family protein
MPNKKKKIDFNIPRREDEVKQQFAKKFTIKRFTMDMPLELHTRLKKAAADENMAMGALLTDIIEKYLGKN